MTGPVGGYDVLVALAEHYHWTPAQVGRMDPDFIDELLVRMRAEADVERVRRKRAERDARRKQRGGEDVDMAEIV